MRFGKDIYIVAAMCAIGILLIFVLSWQADPNLKGLPLIPSWLYNWTDNYNNSRIRTAVPFIFLSLVIGLWLYVKQASFKHYFTSLIALMGVVTVAELGQYFIPLRDADLKAIFWGSAGSFLGLGFMYLVRLFLGLLKFR